MTSRQWLEKTRRIFAIITRREPSKLHQNLPLQQPAQKQRKKPLSIQNIFVSVTVRAVTKDNNTATWLIKQREPSIISPIFIKTLDYNQISSWHLPNHYLRHYHENHKQKSRLPITTKTWSRTAKFRKYIERKRFHH